MGSANSNKLHVVLVQIGDAMEILACSGLI